MTESPLPRRLRAVGAPIIAVWTLLIALLAGVTLYLHHQDTLKEAQSEARDYFRLNQAYRTWAAGLGGVYAVTGKAAPNPYLKVPRRDVATTDGVRLTLINPAYMTRMVFEVARAGGTQVKSKITSLKPINPGNAPDPWERESLRLFETGNVSERCGVALIDGRPYFRFIGRFLTDGPCLLCHAQQGYRLGDVRGGIAISIPLADYLASEAKTRRALGGGYLLLWLVGSCGIAASSRRRFAFEQELSTRAELLNGVSDSVLVIDPQGSILDANDTAWKSRGLTREELLCRPAFGLSTDPELAARGLASLFQTGGGCYECVHVRADGGSMAVEVSGRIIDYRGRKAALTCIRDISHRKRTEENLRRSEHLNLSLNRISALLSARSEREMFGELLVPLFDIMRSPVGLIGYFDERGSLVCHAADSQGSLANHGLSEDFLLPAGELPAGVLGTLAAGKGVFLNAPEPDLPGRPALRRSLAVPLVSGERAIGVLLVANRADDYGDEELEMLTAIGAQVAPVLAARLEEQRATARLAENERKLRVIFDVIQAGVVQIGEKGAVTYANQRMAEMLGVPPGALLGADYLSFVHPDYRPATELGLKELLTERPGPEETEAVHGELRFLRADGSAFWGYLSGRKLAAEGEHATMVGTISDLTELKLAEEKRHKSEQQMLHVQKLESLGVLAGGIAHDFNNILLAIMGNASLALHRLDPGSPAEPHLQQIAKAADKAADLARQMLAYSGKGRFVTRALDLNHLIREMGSMLEVSIAKKVELKLYLAPQLPAVVADPTQIRQIVMNLAINASEAIGDAIGVISIATGCRECDRGYLAETWLNDDLPAGRYVFLEVADTGCGMEPSTVERIFEPFFTTKFTGRGLGMAAILGIVRGHKGAIKVYSEPGKGSSFKVYLPASGQAVETPAAGEADDGWRGHGSVLLVDDEEPVRLIGSEMLRELGFRVVTAVDGEEALELYRQHRGEIVLVLMDLNMPRLSGEEAFRELRRIDPEVRVVLSSGFTEQEVTKKFQGQGLAGFVQKPYTLAILRDTLIRTM